MNLYRYELYEDLDYIVGIVKAGNVDEAKQIINEMYCSGRNAKVEEIQFLENGVYEMMIYTSLR